MGVAGCPGQLWRGSHTKYGTWGIRKHLGGWKAGQTSRGNWEAHGGEPGGSQGWWPLLHMVQTDSAHWGGEEALGPTGQGGSHWTSRERGSQTSSPPDWGSLSPLPLPLWGGKSHNPTSSPSWWGGSYDRSIPDSRRRRGNIPRGKVWVITLIITHPATFCHYLHIQHESSYQ